MTAPDLVRLTASQIQHLLSTGQLTSVELVQASLGQIDRHNKKGLALRAVISVAPDDIVLERAATLDAERARGHVRGPFHGIPILLKVSAVCAVPGLPIGDRADHPTKGCCENTL